MSTFSDLGHPELAGDGDHEISHLDVLGPVAPLADPGAEPGAGFPEMYSPAWHARHAGLCGTWCLPDGERPAPPPVIRDEAAAASVVAAVRASRAKGTTRARTATPPAQVPCRPAAPGELPGNAAALLADALAAGWSAAASYSLGPLPSEKSPCGACGTWAGINKDGSLRAHCTGGGPCSGTGLDGDGRCTTCGARAKLLKRGGLSKHSTPSRPCENTVLDPGAGTWLMKPCVVVRARSPRGHHIAAAWTDGGADGAWLVLAGDRPRAVGHEALRAAFRRLAAQAGPALSGPACPAEPLGAEPGTGQAQDVRDAA